MNFTIKNDLLFLDGKQVDHYKTSKSSGRMKSAPIYVVIHYTAGIRFEDDIRTLSSSSTQASCQLVVSKEGKVAQVGDFRDVLWHAGKSSWDGYTNLNSYSVGIEVTNPGYVDFAYEKDGVNYYRYPSPGGKGGVYWNDRDDVIIKTKHRNGGPEKNWIQFSKAQMDALYGIVAALQAAYPIRQVVGHDMIAPERKIDPGPCLPDDFYDNVNAEKIKGPTGESTEPVIVETSTNLNLRTGAGTEFKIMRTIPKGTRLILIRNFDNTWAEVMSEDRLSYRGYVSSQYLARG